MPIDIKTAIARAKELATEVFESEKIADLLLEEVDFSNGPPSVWLVTVSFLRPQQLQGALGAALAGMRTARTFKVVEVNAATGELIRVTNRPQGIAA